MVEITSGDWELLHKTSVMSGRRLVANTGGYASNVNSTQVRKENEANANAITKLPQLIQLARSMCDENHLIPMWEIYENARRIVNEIDEVK